MIPGVLEEDPFAQFEQAVAEADPPISVSARNLEVPEEDWGLFEQLRNDPKLTSIRDEIAFNRYLRIKLSRELVRSGDDEERQLLLDSIVVMAGRVGVLEEENLGEFRENLNDLLPPATLSLAHIRALSALLQTSGKLAEQQKKIIDGTELKVHISGDADIRKMFIHVIRPAVPREYWAAIRANAKKYGVLLGTNQVIDLEGVLDPGDFAS